MKNLLDEYKIRRSAGSTLFSFAKLGLPLPDQVVYTVASVYYGRADYSRVGDGYPQLVWVWDVLSRNKLAILLTLLDGADYADVVVRTDTRTGENPNPIPAFTTFTAVMWKPLLSGEEGVMIARSHLAFQTVSINFRKLVAV